MAKLGVPPRQTGAAIAVRSTGAVRGESEVAATVFGCAPGAVTLDNGAGVVHSAPIQRLTCARIKSITRSKPERGEPYDADNHSAGERPGTYGGGAGAAPPDRLPALRPPSHRYQGRL